MKKKLRRAEVLRFFEALPPCLVGMEACGTAHFWAREIAAFGHEVRLMPPSYVKAYVHRQKNDAGTLEKDAALFFADPVLAADSPCHEETTGGHGRIEEQTVRAADAAWLAERHPEWKGEKVSPEPVRAPLGLRHGRGPVDQPCGIVVGGHRPELILEVAPFLVGPAVRAGDPGGGAG